jgi:DegV family protein with EDD domain
MQDYIIFTDSTSDLSQEQILEWGVEVLPLSFIIDDKIYYNDHGERDLPSKEFFRLMDAGKMPTTSQVNLDEFKEKAEPFLKDGKDILYIAFSSALSGSYDTSRTALKELKLRYPQRKILAIDTLAASMGEGLLVYLASQNRNNGMNIEKNSEFLENIKSHVCHWVVVENLFHLRRNGRLSSAAAVFGSMLGIRPIIHVDDGGRLAVSKKAKGRKAALELLFEKAKESLDPDLCGFAAIVHACAYEDARLLAQKIENNFNIKILINDIGPVVGSHVGTGTLGLLFLGNDR